MRFLKRKTAAFAIFMRGFLWYAEKHSFPQSWNRRPEWEYAAENMFHIVPLARGPDFPEKDNF